MSGSHTVELADTHRETEVLRHQALDLAAGGRRVALAVIQHKAEHLSLKLRGVAVAPLGQCYLPVTLDALKEPVHGRAMHRNGAATPCLGGCCPKLHLPDDLAFGSLALL